MNGAFSRTNTVINRIRVNKDAKSAKSPVLPAKLRIRTDDWMPPRQNSRKPRPSHSF